MKASNAVLSLVTIFMEANNEHLPVLMKSTESVIKDNQLELLQWLENRGINVDILDELKDELGIL